MKKINKKIIVVFLIVILSGGIYFFGFKNKKNIQYITAKVEKGKLIRTVTETGTVKGASTLNLNFLNSGRIVKINVKTGDFVKKGDVLAELDHRAVSASLNQAKASLASAQANLAKILAGATPIDITIAETNVKQAKQSYESALKDEDKTKKTVAENIVQAKKNLDDLILKTENDITVPEQAIITAQDNLENIKKNYIQNLSNKIDLGIITAEDKLAAGNTALDHINKLLNDNDAKDVLSVKNLNYIILSKNGYDDAKNKITDARLAVFNVKNSNKAEEVKDALNKTTKALDSVYFVLNNCYKMLENSITSLNFSQTKLDSYKSIISGQETIIAASISAVQSANQTISDALLAYNSNVTTAENSLKQAQVNYNNALLSAQNSYNNIKLSGERELTLATSKVEAALKSYELAKTQLEKIKSPARSEDIAFARASVAQAQASVDAANVQVENSIIKAPLDGTITKVNYEIGEETNLSKPVFSMLGDQQFEIEALISEADIAKVKISNKTEIDLDAFGSDRKFQGEVFFIEPASTLIDGVVYYKVKVNFSNFENINNIKAGMTANISIITAIKDDVLKIPARAIIEKSENERIIKKFQGGQIFEIKVVTGIYGDGGMVEIVEGDINVNDEIILAEKKRD